MAEYKSYGMHYIPSDLITIDSPPKDGWETTKDGGGGLKREEIDGSLDKLPDVKAGIDQGYSKEDFDDMSRSNNPEDKAVGDAYHNLYGGAHHTPRGESGGYPPVKVNRDENGGLTTERGQHIVDRAQRQGGREVPAEVMAPPGDAEFEGKQPMRLPSYGERGDERNTMGVESRRNPYEASPENLHSSEQTHGDPMTPQMHDQYHKDTGSAQDDNMSGNDASKHQAAQGEDKMDGSEAESQSAKNEDQDETESGASLG